MAMYRATETFVVNLNDGEPEVMIAQDRAYNPQSDKRIKAIIDRFPDRFESDARTK